MTDTDRTVADPAADERDVAEGAVDDAPGGDATELLVEEVSIDGLCGVY